MRRFAIPPAMVVAFSAVVSVSAAAEEKPPAPPPDRADKIRVLIITGGHDFEQKEFFELFTGHPDLTWQEVKQPQAQEWFAPDKAAACDVMVWYDMYSDISEAAKKNLVALLERGKPLVVLHHAAGDYQDWPEAVRIIGGQFHIKASPGQPASTYRHDVDVPVKIADRQHPVTRFMNGFTIHDEVYKSVERLPAVKPLLLTDHPESDPVIGWTHVYGASPVVYIQLGHDHQAYANPHYRRLVIQAIRWAAGRLPEPSEQGFAPLFNGKNLDGWQVMGDPVGFAVKEGGILRSEVPHKGQWLRSNRMFGDFVLRVDWRVSKDGNSGVFVRAKDKAAGYPWVTGSEIQISNAPRDTAHCTGSLYGSVAVDPRPDESADVWHQFEIHCRGPHYTVFGDDIPIIDLDARQVPALYERPLLGYVGVQDNHSDAGWIEYRNIRIKELTMTTGDRTAWRLGTQAYTFNRFTLFDAIDKAKALGLKYVEIYPGQRLSPDQPKIDFSHDSPPEVLDQVKRKLAEAGISLTCYGVVGIKPDEAAARKVFEFARLMGIETLTTEPEPAAFDLLDKLTQEYGINVAIHNHPKPSRYWDPQVVLDAVRGRNPRIGACADTGHWMRSGLNPLECLKKLEGRIISLHFKDLNKAGGDAHDVPWGTGAADVKAMLAELHRQGFKGPFSIEYEHNWENSMPEIAECIKYFRQVEKELGR